MEYMSDDTLTSILLKTSVDVLLDMYDCKYEILHKLFLFLDATTAARMCSLLHHTDTIHFLCTEYSLPFKQSFTLFLNEYDKQYGFQHLPLPYVELRWKQTTSALNLIKKSHYREDIIDHLLEAEDLYDSFPHLLAAAVATCHDYTISTGYMYTTAEFTNSFPYPIMYEIVLRGYNTNHWKEHPDFDFSSHATLHLAIGTQKWEFVNDIMELAEDFNVYACAIYCNNLELASNLELVPENIRCYLDMTIPSLDELFSYLQDMSEYGEEILSNETIDYLKIDASFTKIESFSGYLRAVGEHMHSLSMFRYLVLKGVNTIDINCLCSWILLHEKGVQPIKYDIFQRGVVWTDHDHLLWLEEVGHLTRDMVIEYVTYHERYKESDKEALRYWKAKLASM